MPPLLTQRPHFAADSQAGGFDAGQRHIPCASIPLRDSCSRAEGGDGDDRYPVGVFEAVAACGDDH